MTLLYVQSSIQIKHDILNEVMLLSNNFAFAHQAAADEHEIKRLLFFPHATCVRVSII